jgi:hypothetical protein
LAAVGAQARDQDAAVLARAGKLLRLQDDGAGAVAEQHAGAAVLPVEDARERLGADHQRALEGAGLEQRVDGREPIDEAGAHRVQVERGALRDAEPGLHRHGTRRKRVVGRRGRQHDQVDRVRLDMRGRERGARRLDGEIGGELPGGGDPALADAGALGDPLVRGVDRLGKLRIGEDALRQVTAAAEHDRTGHAHEAAPATRGAAGGDGPSMRLILARS